MTIHICIHPFIRIASIDQASQAWQTSSRTKFTGRTSAGMQRGISNSDTEKPTYLNAELRPCAACWKWCCLSRKIFWINRKHTAWSHARCTPPFFCKIPWVCRVSSHCWLFTGRVACPLRRVAWTHFLPISPLIAHLNFLFGTLLWLQLIGPWLLGKSEQSTWMSVILPTGSLGRPTIT
jgi:hypothetical protein